MTTAEESIYQYGGLIASLMAILQASYIAKESEKRERDEHGEELHCLIQQHQKEMLVFKQTYLLNIFTDMERHFQQLNADLLANNKESERDMYDQRNQQSQTLIIASTIMLLALVSVLIQGYLPDNIETAIYLTYAIANAGSLALLFITTIIYFQVILLASTFMYKRSRQHTRQLRDATTKTNEMMDAHTSSLRRRSFDLEEDSSAHNPYSYKAAFNENDTHNFQSPSSNILNNHSNENNEYDDDDDQYKNSNKVKLTEEFKMDSSIFEQRGKGEVGNISYNLPHSPRKNGIRPDLRIQITDYSKISGESSDDLFFDMEWDEHERVVRKYLDERNGINDRIAQLYSSEHSFNTFWHEKCDGLARVGLVCFYIGTGLCLVSMATFTYAQFSEKYSNSVAGIITTIPIGIALLIGFIFPFYFRNRKDLG